MDLSSSASIETMIPFRDNVPSRGYPIITVLIIVANITVFLYQFFLPSEALDRFLFEYGVVPAKLQLIGQHPVQVTTGLGVSVLASMFLHGGLFHLVGNMWYLWIFGDNTEDRMGSIRFFFFYFLCGILATWTHILFNLDSQIPTIGASGAVSGVLGAYLVSYPFARVLTLVPLFLLWPVVELPAILVLGSWFFIQLLNGTASLGETSQLMSGVAWWAHIGGFVSGTALIGMFARRPVRRYYWSRTG